MTISEDSQNNDAYTSLEQNSFSLNFRMNRVYTYKFSMLDDSPKSKDPIICLDKSPPLLCMSRIEGDEFIKYIDNMEEILNNGIERIRDLNTNYIDKCIYFGFGCCPCTLGLSALLMSGYFFYSALEYNLRADPIKTEYQKLQKEVQDFIDSENEMWQGKNLKWRGVWSNVLISNDNRGKEFHLELEIE